jgi:hypothetical protein
MHVLLAQAGVDPVTLTKLLADGGMVGMLGLALFVVYKLAAALHASQDKLADLQRQHGEALSTLERAHGQAMLQLVTEDKRDRESIREVLDEIRDAMRHALSRGGGQA